MMFNLLRTLLGNNGVLFGLSANGAWHMSDEPFINKNQVKGLSHLGKLRVISPDVL